MKNQGTQIRVLAILMMAGIMALAAAPAVAIDFDRSCTDTQLADGSCLEIYNDGEMAPVYIVKAVKPDGEGWAEATPGIDWPYTDPATNNAVFTYWAGVSQAYKDGDPGVSKPSAWSYIVFDLSAEPLNAEPPGAQLNLEALPACADTSNAGANRTYYKLNPSVNFKGDAIFSLYAPAGTQVDPCKNGRAYVLFGKECSGGLLAVPHVGALPFVQQRRFWCSEEVFIEVRYDQCTGIPESEIRYVNDITGVDNAVGYHPGAPPFVYADMPGYPDAGGAEYRNFQVDNWGPQYGTLLCTDSDPVFVWKDRAYFCE